MEDYEKQGLLHELFRRQVKLTPDKVAVVEATGKQMTFTELDKASDILANNLLLKGVKPDSCVGIYLDKCLEYTVTYIAILKAGGAYLPLDISYPDLLLKSILDDSTPVAIVTDSSLAHRLEGAKTVILLETGWQERLEKENKSVEKIPPAPNLTLDNLAYIVYSSGTTGKPKGIACPHRGAVFSYYYRHITYPYTEADREACNVFFVWEMLRPLLKGIPMYIIPSTVIYDPGLLCQFLHDNQITRILFTPSLLEAVLNTPDLSLQELLKSLRTVIFCGEVVTTALFERCLGTLPHVQFVNLYSVSECHDVAYENLNDYFRDNKGALTSRKFCPVGRVIPGVQTVILDAEMKPQPVGSSGEIYVGGPTLARGYLNRPEIQAKRFIHRPETVPSGCGPVLYRSGDWGYMLSDGSLEICGRCDSMVKIRGYSIEVQAVEAALMELTSVHACVVLLKGEEGEDKFLVAYIVPKEKATKKCIREDLKRRLPFYMIPSYFVFLTKIPVVQATGKLDKAALPPFDKQSEEEGASEGKPTTATEVALATIWSDILKIKDVDIMESFFDLGGHSLLANQLMNKVYSSFGIWLRVQDLFSYPTVASLAKLIDSILSKEDNQPVALTANINLVDEVDKHDQGIVNIDMQLRAFWRTFAFYNENRFVNGRVLLTGVTGFLGAFILKELLLQTKVFVFCIIRELPDMTPAERLQKTLQQYGMLPLDGASADEEQNLLAQLVATRVRPLKGNVALINLGLSDEEYTYVCTDVDFIVHAAATVNLIYPYTALHGANVLGTSNVILFACTGKIKPLHFISTDAVFPGGMKDCSEVDDTAGYHTLLLDGYSQSKWVAEQLVQRAGRRGMPVTIYRLGNLSGDQSSAYWNPQDFTLAILKCCCRIGLAPDVDWDVEMTPVDFAASFIVKMAKKSSVSIGKTFHVINDKPLKSRWIFEWMNANGYPLKIVAFEKWKKRVMELNEGEGENGFLHSVVYSYIRDASFFSQLNSYRCDCFHDSLSELGVTYPYTDSHLLKTYFSKLSQRNIIKRRKNRFHSSGSILQDKVAIVTGASSGIGKAIALALAGSGVKVAMAARRVDLLKEVESQITKVGSVCISVKTDVTDRAQVKDLVKHTEMTLGPVDILVNNAGVMYYTMMKNLHEDEWDRQIDVNVKGLTNCIGAVLDGMLERAKGHIVNMSSDAARKGFPGLAVYSGTKFYVEGLSQALRQEVCGSGVRVTCIQPGDVRTELLSHTTDKEAQEAYDGSSKCKILEPTDIANAVLYAVTQPEYVGVNEILIEPREAPV